ncbi:hypothetical protein Syun_024004 [Stephania yunnanensis]|uniref:Uncharacterized protein n=1 Tax=Stephania yunnanensis TaxID=152371 RepID=A0AAP0FPP7_9MAGN
MSYAAYKMMHWPTGIENCASGFITHCGAEFAPQIPMVPSEDFEIEWSVKKGIGLIPNLVVTAGNVLEVYAVRVQEEDDNKGSRSPVEAKRDGFMDGLFGASLELGCHYKLHGNVETMAILPVEGGDNYKKRDSIILAFRDAKISILEFDDSIYGLRTRTFHMTPTSLFVSHLLLMEFL